MEKSRGRILSYIELNFVFLLFLTFGSGTDFWRNRNINKKFCVFYRAANLSGIKLAVVFRALWARVIPLVLLALHCVTYFLNSVI